MMAVKSFLIHLNTQTNSNSGFSLIKIKELVEWAASKQMGYLSISDYQPYKVWYFFKLCGNQKIKPIWGIKIFFLEKKEDSENKKKSLTVFPRNNTGYKQIVKFLFSLDSPRDRIFILEDLLSKFGLNCLIVLEARRLEDIYLFSSWLEPSHFKKKIVQDNIFIGLTFFLFLPNEMINFDLQEKLIPFFPIKFISDEKDEKVLKALAKTSLASIFFLEDREEPFYPYYSEDVFFNFCTNDADFYQSLLLRCRDFVIKININIDRLLDNFRKDPLLEKDNFLVLKKKCWNKLFSLPFARDKKYQDILKKELLVIKEMGFSGYLLVFGDVVDYLQKEKIIVGPGRGSAVSSLVVYLMNISKIDPVKYNLFFERFLNKYRGTLPDIDLDVEDQKKTFDYLFNKYPKNCVNRIIVRKKIGWKTAIQEVAKIFYLEKPDLQKVIDCINEKRTSDTYELLQPWRILFPDFFQIIDKIHGLYYDIGIHPSALIINEKNSSFPIPLISHNGYPVALLDKDDLDVLGLLKYDFLSLKESLNLIRLVKTDFASQELPDYSQVDLCDKKTWKMLNDFLLSNIFQLDTVSAKKVFMKFRPKNFFELVIFTALNRPGNIAKLEEIIDHKNSNFLFLDKAIKNILDSTFGCVIFEEQISQIISIAYGINLAKAEKRRRELKNIPLLEDDFLLQVKKTHIISDGKLIYRQIVNSLNYSFPKSHAVAYALLTYYCAYLKANYFSELTIYWLNNFREKIFDHLQEAFFSGYEIILPDINFSFIDWVCREKKMIMGFSGLSNHFQSPFLSKVLEERENGLYVTWENFLQRTFNFWDEIDVKILETWIKIGLFNSLKVPVPILLDNVTNILRFFYLKKIFNAASEDYFPTNFSFSSEGGYVFELKNINELEREVLGHYISFFSRWQEVSSKRDLSVFLDFDDPSFDIPVSADSKKKTIKVYAVISNITELKNTNHFILFLQDVRGSSKVLVIYSVYQKNKNLFIKHNELLFTLFIEKKDGKFINLICNKVKKVDFS